MLVRALMQSATEYQIMLVYRFQLPFPAAFNLW